MKTSNNFKLGDRVKIIGNVSNHTHVVDGELGTIVKKYDNYCAVRDDSNYGYTWWCYYNDLEVA